MSWGYGSHGFFVDKGGVLREVGREFRKYRFEKDEDGDGDEWWCLEGWEVCGWGGGEVCVWGAVVCVEG